jgi:hypothetical protein
MTAGPYCIHSSGNTVSVDNRIARAIRRRVDLQRLQAVAQYNNYLDQGGTAPPNIQPWVASIRARATAPPVAQLRPVDVRVPYLVLAAASLVPAAVTVPLFLRRRRPASRAGRCTACDYDLTGNVSGVCPECGKPCT